MTRGRADVRRATFQAQLARARTVMRRNGLNVRIASPPLWRLLWICGVRLPPPPFCGFAVNATLVGAQMLVLMEILVAVMGWFGPGVRLWLALAFVPLAVLAGLYSAREVRRAVRKHGLPTWESFARPVLPGDEDPI